MRVSPAVVLSFMLILLVLTACGERPPEPTAAPVPVDRGAKRSDDPVLLATGQRLFQAHCAQCHGEDAAGAANWRQPGADGRYPAPPLNGTGHDWHHPTEVLMHMIRNGSPAGQGNMPAWGGKLSDDEIRAVIAWFQSLWSDPVYAVWYQMQQRSQSQ